AFGGFAGINFMPEPEWSRSTHWLTCLTVDPDLAGVNNYSLINACAKASIETRPLWKPMHMQPVFEGTRFIGSGFCERLFETGLCIPSGSGLRADEQDRVIEVITNALQAG
ncbi:MAG: DegT/DnrJ/EryC1/StrS family aminotransferase, partial [Salaquimonas sp.]